MRACVRACVRVFGVHACANRIPRVGLRKLVEAKERALSRCYSSPPEFEGDGQQLHSAKWWGFRSSLPDPSLPLSLAIPSPLPPSPPPSLFRSLYPPPLPSPSSSLTLIFLSLVRSLSPSNSHPHSHANCGTRARAHTHTLKQNQKNTQISTHKHILQLR